LPNAGGLAVRVEQHFPAEIGRCEAHHLDWMFLTSS
jgi:hypothetical protein